MFFSLFATATILFARKVGVIDNLKARYGHLYLLPWWERMGISKLLTCYFCLGFWIVAFAWTGLQLITWDFEPIGYLYAFCAAPVVDYLTLIILLNDNDHNQPGP